MQKSEQMRKINFERNQHHKINLFQVKIQNNIDDIDQI